MASNKTLSQILNQATEILRTGNKAQVVEYLSNFCNTQPDNAALPRDIGIFFQQNNMPLKAEIFYHHSLSLDNSQAAIHFNLGVIYQNMNRTEQAVQAYLQAIEAQPDYARAFANLGYIYHETGNSEKCRECCLNAQRLEPENPQIKHMIAALGVEPLPDTADQQYIKNLYKEYANHYDEHLSVTLKSRVPELIHNTTLRHLSSTPAEGSSSDSDSDGPGSANLALLDLGCGTGICGQLFSKNTGNMTLSITGVDLSEEMVEEARKKDIYHQLCVSDIGEYLKTIHSDDIKKFDIIISSDVLIYIGNLQGIFSGAYNALNSAGLFSFSIESSTDTSNDFILDATGRYKHNPQYISHIAKASNFNILSSDEKELRQQNNRPVNGIIYVLSKA